MTKVKIVGANAAGQCLPEGEYTVMVNSATFAEGKVRRDNTQGQDRIDVEFVVCEGQYQNEVFNAMFFPFHENAFLQRRLAAFSNAIGLTNSEDANEVEVETDDFIGKVLVVEGAPRMFNGRKQFEIAEFRAQGEEAPVEEQASSQPEEAPAEEQPAPQQQAAAPAQPSRPQTQARPQAARPQARTTARPAARPQARPASKRV